VSWLWKLFLWFEEVLCFHLMQSLLSILVFIDWATGILFRKLSTLPMSSSDFLM
jgi:hypothetical protein